MTIDPISWMIIGFVVGLATGYFWDEIKEWAARMLGYILDAIDRAINVISDAVVYLVKEGTRVYKRIEVHVRNIYSRKTELYYKQEEVSRGDIPDDINADLDRKMKIKLLQQST